MGSGMRIDLPPLDPAGLALGILCVTLIAAAHRSGCLTPAGVEPCAGSEL